MAENIAIRSRLCLVTRPSVDLEVFSRLVGEALSGGDVASLIIVGDPLDPARSQRAAELFVPIAQNAGAAAIVHNDTRIAGRARADGVHIDTGLTDTKSAIAALRPKRIVGAGGIRSRHEVMAFGEAGPDYLFFGRLDGDTADEVHAKSLELAAWCATVTVIPTVVMGGKTIASVRQAPAEGIEFVALSSAVWDDPRGPRAAVADACEQLATAAEAVE